MTTARTDRPVAMESVRHRRGSRIGTQQRYYLLSRPMVVGADVPRAVLVIPDPPRNSCTVYPATPEGDIADFADMLTDDADPTLADHRRLVEAAVVQRPGFTLRGGTNEVLRGVIARGLGLR